MHDGLGRRRQRQSVAIRQGQRSCGSRCRGTRSAAQAGGTVPRRRRRGAAAAAIKGLSCGLAASALVVHRAASGRASASIASTRPSAASSSGSARSRVSRHPGLQWHLPWPIESAEKINTGATEPLNYRASMLTRDENIVNVALVVQFRRTDPQSFLFNLRNPEATLEAATASAIREVDRPQRARLHPDRGARRGLGAGAGSAASDARFVRSRDHDLRSQLGRRRVPGRGRSGRAGFDPRPRRPRAAHSRSADLLERDPAESARRGGAAAPRGRGLSRASRRRRGRRVGPVHADPRRVPESAGRHARAHVHRDARGDLADVDEGARRHGRRQQPAVPAARSARRSAARALRPPSRSRLRALLRRRRSSAPRSRERDTAR